MKPNSEHNKSALRALPPHQRAEALRDMLRKRFGERPGVAPRFASKAHTAAIVMGTTRNTARKAGEHL